MASKSKLESREVPDVICEKNSLTDTDETDEDDDSVEDGLPQLTGTLHKWTNYLHGWQERYFVLKEGTLTYFKSQTDRSFGCRGAVSLARAIITCHPVDECRFDITVNENLWYLRADSAEDRVRWFNNIDLHRQAESGYGSMNSLRRQGSLISITSANSISTSTSSFKRGRGLPEKLAEMETFRDILCRQVDTLQGYFDACTQALSVLNKNSTSVHDLDHGDIDDNISVDSIGSPTSNIKDSNLFTTSANDDGVNADLEAIFQQHGAHAIDFKGEAITFKATTAGIISTLSHCLELMGQREDAWKKKYDKEVERRKKVEELYKSCKDSSRKPIVIGGPDYEEGPTCIINEEEFFDAVDASMDKLETDAELLEKRKEMSKNIVRHTPAANTPGSLLALSPSSRLFEEVNSVIAEHIKYADSTLDSSVWEAIHDEGEMKVYRREMEEDGMIVDPLKAVHHVQGVTGHELCHYFWDNSVRMEWEGTLDSTATVEVVSEDTVITHQVHKRVWPTTQRDSVFWSHIRHVPSKDDTSPDVWIVCNFSTEHDKAPLNNGMIRLKMNLAMICESRLCSEKLTRANVRTKISYHACGETPSAVPLFPLLSMFLLCRAFNIGYYALSHMYH
ncbi:ceramide transfer protein-like isoform X2 [Watersipora subatra]|uniref:ceramide transfer protein-like isoform X2 n=1 Tax=Watersipora subatra TaxID=2589382 RepID=UPI00355B22DC